MDYVIKNNNNVYIKLNEIGSPITCSESCKGLFEYSKAHNILNSLPKTLKRLNFFVEGIPDIQIIPKEESKTQEKILMKDNYKPPDEVLEWLNKFITCENVISEAKQRIAELNSLISEADKKISDVQHRIELESDKNMYQGYLLYADLRTLLRKRRKLKDESIILHNFSNTKFFSFSSQKMENAIKGLAKRKYTFRIDDGDEEDLENDL